MIKKEKRKTYTKVKDREKINTELRKFITNGGSIVKHKRWFDTKYYVYYLIDPLYNSVFYIGKGSGNRLYEHEKLARQDIVSNNNIQLFKRIKEILARDQDIVYRKVWFTNREWNAYAKEKELIKNIGLENLTNIKPGGI